MVSASPLARATSPEPPKSWPQALAAASAALVSSKNPMKAHSAPTQVRPHVTYNFVIEGLLSDRQTPLAEDASTA